MAAYPSYQRASSAREHPHPVSRRKLGRVPAVPTATALHDATPDSGLVVDVAAVDQLVQLFVERVAAAVAERLVGQSAGDEDSLDSRHAAEYLGVHRDTLRKLVAERAIPAEQDGPGCKLYFRRSELDAWRRSGGRPRHLVSKLAAVA
jgi:excisionase family DNA binding protein